MSKTKILRCDAPGCRKLTAHGLCDSHRVTEQPIEPSANDEKWKLIFAEAQRRADEMAERSAQAKQEIFSAREELADLSFTLSQVERRNYRPVFDDRANL